MVRQDFPPEPRAEYQSDEWYRQNRERPTAGRCPYWDHNLGCPSDEATRLPVVIEYDGPEQEPVPSDPRAFVPADLGADDLGPEAS